MHIGTVFALFLLSIILIIYIAQPFLKEEANQSNKSVKLSNRKVHKKVYDPSKVCQSCGCELRPQDQFCPQCGALVEKTD